MNAEATTIPFPYPNIRSLINCLQDQDVAENIVPKFKKACKKATNSIAKTQKNSTKSKIKIKHVRIQEKPLKVSTVTTGNGSRSSLDQRLTGLLVSHRERRRYTS